MLYYSWDLEGAVLGISAFYAGNVLHGSAGCCTTSRKWEGVVLQQELGGCGTIARIGSVLYYSMNWERAVL